jgi:hypothetical protein
MRQFPVIEKAKWQTDWCHLCGVRSQIAKVDVHYPPLAYGTDPEQRRNVSWKYIRICLDCISHMTNKTNE